jgi:APA family basic amino acid/polyamine antiporter
MSADPAPELRRDLGLLQATAVGLGAILGAGIFVVIAVAAEIAGPALLIGLVLAGCLATCNALSSAQLAARYPTSGGTYEYGYELLSPEAGFAAGWLFLVSKLSAGGVVALGLGAYAAKLFPGADPRWVACGSVATFTVANLAGVKKAGLLNLLIVAVTVSVLLAFVVGAIPAFQTENLQPFLPRKGVDVLTAGATIFFAFTGYARVATLAEEVRDPKVTIPRAILLALGISTLLYLAVATTAVGVLGAQELSASTAPIVLAAQTAQGSMLAGVVGLGALTAMLGVQLSQIMGISRVMLAMARRGDLPPFLSHVSARFGVPDRAIQLTSGIILALALFGNLAGAVVSATFSILLYYAVTNLAALRLGTEDRFASKWVASLGLAGCVALALAIPPIGILSGLGILAVGFALRAVLRIA